MPLEPNAKKTWEEVQKKFNFPVNAIGIRITEKDKMTFTIWKSEGIDKFMKK